MDIGVYTPYLRNCGGGENYIGKMVEILSQKNNVEFLTIGDVNLNELESKLNLDLSKVTVKKVKLGKYSVFFTLEMATKKYDLFINQEHKSIIPAHAKRNILVQEVPFKSLNYFPTSQKITHQTSSLFNFSKWASYHKLALFDPKWSTYNSIIVNSFFTKNYIEEFAKKKANVLYPFVNTNEFKPSVNRENIILSVGKLISVIGNKKQIYLIRTFKQMIDDGLSNWEYHLVGNSMGTQVEQAYIDNCKEESRGYPICFHINEPFKSLKEIYGKAKIFWHAKGFGESEEFPERFEHFGMATIEAMASGCVPVVINKGGQKEIVRNGVEGFLWDTLEEMKSQTIELAEDSLLWNKMSEASVKRSQNYSLKQFEKRVNQLLG